MISAVQSVNKLVTKNREFTDWTAEIIQHMIDHSKGKLV